MTERPLEGNLSGNTPTNHQGHSFQGWGPHDMSVRSGGFHTSFKNGIATTTAHTGESHTHAGWANPYSFEDAGQLHQVGANVIKGQQAERARVQSVYRDVARTIAGQDAYSAARQQGASHQQAHAAGEQARNGFSQ